MNLFLDWQVKVEQTARLNANSTTVIEYCNLAKAGLQMADLIIKFCAKSVSEHQLLNKVRLIRNKIIHLQALKTTVFIGMDGSHIES